MGSQALSRKILSYILATSTLITTLLTGFNLYLDYRSELSILHNSFRQLERLSLGPLSAALWSFDDGQTRKILEGIVATADFWEVSVEDLDGSLLYHLKRREEMGPSPWWSEWIGEPHVLRRYSLNLQVAIEPPKIVGFLNVKASKIAIVQRLLEKLRIIFALQGIKTLLISLIILAIFQRHITRHLIQIANYLERYRQKGFQAEGSFVLKRRKQKPDEIDSLVVSLNVVLSELDKYLEQNAARLRATEQELETQRIAAIQSARLASLGEMAGGIAHEINNPLAIILASADRLSRELSKGNLYQVERFTEQIRQTCQRIAQVVTSLRKLSRDGGTSSRSHFLIYHLVQEVMSLCEEKIRWAGIRVSIEMDEGISVFANEVELSQVLFNLLANACDAISGSQEPWILISGQIHEGEFQLSITDSGRGIPESLAERIMEPFFTTKDVGKGTGLGLSISLSIAKRHGGDLRLDPHSTHTKFDLTLPLAQS